MVESDWRWKWIALILITIECFLLFFLGKSDLNDIEHFEWNDSISDVLMLCGFRLCIGLLISLLLVKNRIILFICSFIFSSSGIYGIVKIAAAHGLHDREKKILLACWFGLIFPIFEGIIYLFMGLGEKVEQTIDPETTENGGYTLLEDENDDNKYHKTGASFRRVLALAWPERYLLMIGIVCLLVSSASQMIIPTIFGKIISTISDHQPSQDHALHELNEAVLFLIVVFIVSSLFSLFRGALFNLSGERVVARFRVRVFDAVLSQDISFFDQAQSGELQSRLSNDTTVIQDAVTSNISMGLRFGAQVIVGLAIMFALSWKLTLITCLVVPAIAIGARQYGMFMRKLSSDYQASLGRAGERAEQSFSCIRTVRSFARESYEIEKYRESIMGSYKVGVKKAWAYGCFIGVVLLAGNLACALVLWYGGRIVIKETSNDLDASKLTAFLLYTIFVAFALGGLSGLYSQLTSAVGASERMFELIDREPEIKTNKSLNDDEKHQQLITGHVKFQNVKFAYPTRKDVQVLKGINFECSPGEIVACVGSSGAGKSTVVNLILRMYDPNEGLITLDGKDLRSYNTVQLHQSIAVVSQMPVLFSTTIEENIRYGAHRNVSKEEIEKVLDEANASEFVSRFPDGLQTMVGERGVTLSGGQKQRIAIARALIASPTLLLLDEATSSLDSESEYLVQQALDRAMTDRTTLVIAHRLSTVRNADCILVFEHGEITERGTHADLMKNKDGLYSSLVARQLQS